MNLDKVFWQGERGNAPSLPFRALPKATGFLKDDGKNGRMAIYKELRDAHVDEGNAAHVGASLAVAFGRHAAAMGSNVLSNRIERENALAYPCAPLPKATWFLKDACKMNAYQALPSGHLWVKPVMAQTNDLSKIRIIRHTLRRSLLLLLEHRVGRK